MNLPPVRCLGPSNLEGLDLKCTHFSCWCVHKCRTPFCSSTDCACSLQDDTVQARTSQIPRRGRPISAAPSIPSLTFVSCGSTARRGAATPTESTRCCPAPRRTDAREVKTFSQCMRNVYVLHELTPKGEQHSGPYSQRAVPSSPFSQGCGCSAGLERDRRV